MESWKSSYKPHLEMARHYWQSVVKPGDTVIDATCGNGQDTLTLCNLVFDEKNAGSIYAIDIQPQALINTKSLLEKHVSPATLSNIQFLQQCHTILPHLPESVKLIVYNLGYLPRDNKECTTTAESTLQSLTAAMPLIQPNGAISLMFYPGHLEGEQEEKLILEFVSTLDRTKWICCHHRWVNRLRSPSFLFMKKTSV